MDVNQSVSAGWVGLNSTHLLNLDFEEAKQYAQAALHLDSGNALAQQVFDKICQFQRDYVGKAKENTDTMT